MGWLFSDDEVLIKNDIATTAMTNVIVSLTANCTAAQSNTQILAGNTLDISGNTGSNIAFDISQDIKTKLSASCIQSSNVQNDLKNKLSTELDSLVSKLTVGLGAGSAVGSTDTNMITNLKNTIVNNININNISNCLVNGSNLQEAISNVISITKNIDSSIQASFNQKVFAEIIYKCVQSDTTVNKASTDLTNLIKSTSSTTEKGLDLNAMFDSAMNTINGFVSAYTNIIIMIILAIIGLLIFAPGIVCIIPPIRLIGSVLGLCGEKDDKKENDTQPINQDPRFYQVQTPIYQ